MVLKRVGRRISVALSCVAGLWLLQGCMENEGDSYDAYAFLQEDIETIKTYLESNSLSAQLDTASGIYYETHSEGDGYRTLAGIEIDVNYHGETLEGVEFVNTFEEGIERVRLGDPDANPRHFTLGLNLAMLLLSEGDSATVYLPSPYGFQNNSYVNVEPNSILVYHVKFEDIPLLDADNAKIDQYIADSSMTAKIEPKYGLRYVIHESGSGDAPRPGASVRLHYHGELIDGTVFDSSVERGTPWDFVYGEGSTIRGFEIGVSQLHEGDSATIFVPSIYGYGDQAGGSIPANSVLVFGLEILQVLNF